MREIKLIKIILIGLFSFFITLYLSTDSFASGSEENILKIQRAYENIKDLKGSFVQKNTIKDLNRTDIYEGEFFIKYPFKMKWIYTGKASQDITINNDSVLIYKKGDNQAYKGNFDRSTYGQTPVALLSGFGNIEDEFNISCKDNLLILKPKRQMGNITLIKLTMSGEDFPINSFEIQDGNSNLIEIELKDIKINTGLKNSLFELSLPKGVNIYEYHP